jgi:hypothetical protein
MVNTITAVMVAQRNQEHQMKHNIKYKLADHMRNSMHMPDDMLQHLEVYKMMHWNVPQFKNELTDGTIAISNGIYNVIYHQCTPAAAKSAKEIRLSFRKAKPEFGIEPYVLVQIVSQ